MEPTTLAASAIALLSPYLAKAGTKAADEVGKKLPEYAAKIWTAIRDKFKGKPAAEEAVQDLLEKPEDGMKQVVFQNQLLKVLESDDAFAESLLALLSQAGSEAKGQGGDTITNTGSGAIATGGSVAAGEGGVAVGRDVHGSITLGQSKPQD
jgi:hypothetical protein